MKNKTYLIMAIISIAWMVLFTITGDLECLVISSVFVVGCFLSKQVQQVEDSNEH